MAKLIVVAALALLLFLLWRKWSRQRRAGFIERYLYQRYLDSRLERAVRNWMPDSGPRSFSACATIFSYAAWPGATWSPGRRR